MKKNYVQPSSESVNFEVETVILTASIPMGGDTPNFESARKNPSIWGKSDEGNSNVW